MNDDKTAKDYNIEGGSVLHLVSWVNLLEANWTVCLLHAWNKCFLHPSLLLS